MAKRKSTVDTSALSACLPGDIVSLFAGAAERVVEVTGHAGGGVLVRDVDVVTYRVLRWAWDEPKSMRGDEVVTVLKRGVERWLKQQGGEVETDPLLKGAA